MAYIEPLALQTWFINVLAGSPDIFAVISFLVISVAAGFFRMPVITLFFMLGIFVLIFTDVIGLTWIVLFGIIGGMLISFWINSLIKR